MTGIVRIASTGARIDDDVAPRAVHADADETIPEPDA